MEIKLNEENSLIVDSENGCKIEKLILKGKTIVNSIQGENFLGSGSYLMFPWVNRVVQTPYGKIVQNKFTDGKGYPLHGLYMNTKRVINIQKIEENQKICKIIVNIQNGEQNENIHSFTETFILTQNSLEINIKVIPSMTDPNSYCFGYHPYFELSKPINQMKIQTNLSYQIQLEEDLLVKWPQKKIDHKQDLLIDPLKKYDSLFRGEQQLNWVEFDDGLNKLRVESDLKYWQIYTPQDGKRIAIQPMSFHGNLYEIVKQNPQVKQNLPKEGRITITIK